jgi:threonine dehydrogenase-like Zn-dependent dehydrogenase
MRAVRVVSGVPQVVDVAEPAGDGVRVRVAASGICGSDLAMIDAGWAPPVTMGHEIAGWAPDGTPVAIEPLDPCGRCEPCRSGAYHLCVDAAATMIGIGVDGGWAAELVVPERCLVPLPSGLSVADAPLVEPIAVALHGLGLVGHHPEQRIAIVGGGTIGLCALAAIRSRGGRPDVVARHDHQAAAVEALGGRATVGDSYDLVVETAGTADALRHAVRLARPGAAVLLLSMHWEPTVTPGVAMWMKEVRLVPSITYGLLPHDGQRSGRREIDEAARVLAEWPDVAPTLITHRFPLEAAADAVATARDRAQGSIKVVLEPT